MTSLAGIIYPDMLQTTDLIDPMLDTLKNNVIEPSDIFTHKNFQIGCVNAHIKMNAKKTIYVMLDGNLDNSEELLKLFEINDSLSQEEILIAGYEKHDLSFIENVDGDFAIVLLDLNKQTLFLIRDRIGKKPLYWYQDRHYFAFSSELKALLASGIVPQTPSPDAIATYFFFGYTPQDLTAIKDISKLLPAHYLRITPGHGKSVQSYWSYSSYFEHTITKSQSYILDEIDSLLSQSVSNNLKNSLKPIGCFLSGGLGSATVAYYMSKALNHEGFPVFNVGFENQNEEDIKAAGSAAADLNLQFNSYKITRQNFLQDIVKIVWHLDEPLADPNVVATWNLCKFATGDASTVFSGMGSDELLAGHSRYSIAERDVGQINRLTFLPKSLLQNILVPFLKIFAKETAYNLLKVSRTNPWQFEYLRDNALFTEKILSDASPHLAGLFDPDSFLHKFHHLNRIHSMVSSFLYFDVKTRLPDSFIFQYNRMMHTYRLNWKTPFLDRNLVEFAAQLREPEVLQESETAFYLKPLIKDVFSPSFFNRPKKTRKYFLSSWMKDPQLFHTMKLLTKGTLVETGFISERWLREQLKDPNSAAMSFRYLFAILMLEIWFRLFINRPVHTHPPALSVQELLSEG